MEKGLLSKIKKMYRIQDVFIKYNIFDKNAFENDHHFCYILEHFDVDHHDFNKTFNTKYRSEITKSATYRCNEQSVQPDNQQSTPIDDKSDNQQSTPIDDKEVGITSIKYIDKYMFKKIAFVSHPDKSKKYDDGYIFSTANDYMKLNWTIGLINCCFLLHIKVDCIDLHNDEIITHIYKQMRTILQEIISLYNVRNSQ